MVLIIDKCVEMPMCTNVSGILVKTSLERCLMLYSCQLSRGAIHKLRWQEEKLSLV